MKKRNQIFSLVLAILLIVGMLPLTAFAADSKTYLAIGDSISTGYGLADPETESFTAQVAAILGEDYTYVNLAEDGETSGSLYAKLSGDTFKAAVQNADVITLTIGGNDLMNLFYEFLAENMVTDPQMTADEIADALEAGNMNVINAAAAAVVENNLTLGQSDITAIAMSFSGCINLIRTLNPNAVLIVATQYNPYAELARMVKQYETMLSGTAYATVAAAISMLSSKIDNALVALNGIITTLAPGKYEVALVHEAFTAAGSGLCNAGLTLFPSASVNLDIHPNATGHTLIAQEFEKLLPEADCEHVFDSDFDPDCNICGFQRDVNPFTDVTEADWCYDEVLYVYQAGLMNGISATTFGPFETTTRGMIVTILWRQAGSPAVTAGTEFSDVNPADYYSQAILWASANGIVNGYGEGKFGPNDPITREQLAAILWRYAKYLGLNVSASASLDGYQDGETVTPYAQDAMKWAVAMGIVSGKADGILDPNGNAQRCEVAAILYRLTQLIGN